MKREEIESAVSSNEKIITNITYNLEVKLSESYQYYWKKGQEYSFFRENYGNQHCRYFESKANKKLLIILPDLGESSLHYSELIWDLKDSEFDVLIIDHRGMGFSDRGPFTRNAIHISNFNEYVEDMEKTVNFIKNLKEYKSSTVIGAGLGALIAMTQNLEKATLFNSLIMITPLLKLGIHSGVSGFINSTIEIVTKTPIYYSLENLNSKSEQKLFRISKQARCPIRAEWCNYIERKYPQILSAYPTIMWNSEVAKACKRVLNNKDYLKLPCLILQAENDFLVSNKTINKFSHNVINSRIIRLKESSHHILQEKSEIRDRALIQIFSFLRSYNLATLK